MNLLLNHMLVLGIIRIQNHDRLPPAAALIHIADLQRGRGNQHGQRQPLRVHSRLHQLLGRGEEFVAVDQRQRDADRGYPGGGYDGVAVLARPVFGFLEGAFVGAQRVLLDAGGVFVVARGLAVEFEAAGGAVGGDDCGEGGGGGYEEGFLLGC